MTIRWIIIGLLYVQVTSVTGQISQSGHGRLDSLLQALNASPSNYQTGLITNALLEIVDTTSSTTQLYDIYRARALSQSRSGDYREALISQQKANQIAHALQDSFLIAQSTYSIGSILYNQQQFGFARQHFERAASAFERLDSTSWLAYVHNAYGLLERENKNWTDALVHYRRSFALLKAYGPEGYISVPLNNIGDVYFQQGKYQDALATFEQSLQLAGQLDRKNDMAIAHLNKGQALRELGRRKAALEELHLGLSLAHRQGFRQIEALALKDLSETYKKWGNHDSAYLYLETFLQLEDSLREATSQARFEELYLAYETQRSQIEMDNQKRQINALRQEKKLDHLTDYFIISLLMLALILSSFFFVRNRMKRKLAESELRNQRLEAKEIRRELEGKQKDLTNLALEIARKNELFIQTNKTLAEVDLNNLPASQQNKVRQLIQFNANQLRINEDLKELMVNIEQVNTDFFEKLQQVAPDLTPNERQLCALFRLNLSNKDIASIRNISPKSVEMARYRLRKKLPLEAGDDIYTFMQSI